MLGNLLSLMLNKGNIVQHMQCACGIGQRHGILKVSLLRPQTHHPNIST